MEKSKTYGQSRAGWESAAEGMDGSREESRATSHTWPPGDRGKVPICSVARPLKGNIFKIDE